MSQDPDALFERLQGALIGEGFFTDTCAKSCLGCDRTLMPGEHFHLIFGSPEVVCPDCKSTLGEYDMEDAL